MNGQRWRELELGQADGHPAEDALCVVRRVEMGYDGLRRVEYMAGRFRRDEQDPGGRKLWWQDGRSQILQNPEQWKARYESILWLPIEGPEEVTDG